jgi:hypothetical protein
MNCAECLENMVACLEGLLEPEISRECQSHLESCAACQAEYAALGRLQARLEASGHAAAQVAMVEPVMRRIRQAQTKSERTTIVSRLMKYRWGFGLGAAAAAAAVIVLFIALAAPTAHAKAAEVMARGARALAKLTTVHLRGQLRTLPADNFSFIAADMDFYPIELWKQLEPELKWRVEKPGRVAVMDGRQTVLYIKTAKLGNKFPHPSTSAFDTDWLQRIANLSNTISNELRHAQAQEWKLTLAEETATDGRVKSVVSVFAKSGLPDDDYCKNNFLENADTRRVYRFDAQTERLEAVQIYLNRGSDEVQIFELNQIDYDQPIDVGVWQLDLPADVIWVREPQALPDSEKYVSMTAEEAARAFFEACGREDWAEVAKFNSAVTGRLKEYLGGVQIVSLGKAFTSRGYPGRFVPYEIKLKHGEVKKFNLAIRKDNPAHRWQVDGGL